MNQHLGHEDAAVLQFDHIRTSVARMLLAGFGHGYDFNAGKCCQ